MMFKIMVLQALYSLSDDQAEFQVQDRLSFMRFLGLGLGDRAPDGEPRSAPLMEWMAPASGIAMCHIGRCERGQQREPSVDEIARIGVDLAKSAFQLRGVDAEGRPLLRRQLRRSQMLEFFQRQSACLIGMEACASAH